MDNCSNNHTENAYSIGPLKIDNEPKRAETVRYHVYSIFSLVLVILTLLSENYSKESYRKLLDLKIDLRNMKVSAIAKKKSFPKKNHLMRTYNEKSMSSTLMKILTLHRLHHQNLIIIPLKFTCISSM